MLIVAQVIWEHASAKYFHKVLPASLRNYLANTTAVTVFLPQDSAWDELGRIERVYLESSFAEDDMRMIIDMHSVVQKGVHWSDTFKNDTKRELLLHLLENVCKRGFSDHRQRE